VFYNNAVLSVICEGWYFIITLFVLLYVRVGILYVHYNNAVQSVICEGWYFIITLFGQLYVKVGIL
jgi:hypothetical protein